MLDRKRLSLILPFDNYEDTEADKARAMHEHELGMVLPCEPLLMQKSRPIKAVELQSASAKNVIERLYAAAEGQRRIGKGNKKRRTLVGLAAPQIGELVRIVLVDTGVKPGRKKYGKLECFINPVIVWHSRETEEDREGCFSAGAVWGLVRRPIAVKVKALNQNGKSVERVLEGFTARIAQHEIDHLDGVRFADLIKSDRKRHWVHAEELEIYPKNIRRWPRICTRERWDEVKGVTPTQ
ncbi:MAG TPA: peptide deformylase [Candidatus Saccharimonadales bacterium]